jgi:hypothetical protein
MPTETPLTELEERIRFLTVDEQLWLAERLLHHARIRRGATLLDRKQELTTMAADPEIQREIQAIEQEFTSTESDGLPEE